MAAAMPPSLTDRATAVAYRAQHLSVMVPTTVFNAALRFAGTGRTAPRPHPDALALLRQRYDDLLTRDLEQARAGLYPKSLLFSLPMRTYARRLPKFLADVPAALTRRARKEWRDLPEDVDLERYPPYFRRTFHWQTDGYLSAKSAALYDLEVEILFGGAADVMRRQILPPLTRWLDARGGARGKRLLDVACGTGRVLRQVAAAHPELSLYGLDLSPYYLKEASRTLSDVPHVSLVAENAEAMPFKDASFDVVSCVYLFHELPRGARRRVLEEIARVVKPGGLVLLEDSAQYVESEPLRFFLDRFPEAFHEPYYADYLRDDLAEVAEGAGLSVVTVDPAFVAKVVVARKPE
jgi:ubiquinone/menaquinone biosynthesis C-methylase UbiE